MVQIGSYWITFSKIKTNLSEFEKRNAYNKDRNMSKKQLLRLYLSNCLHLTEDWRQIYRSFPE